MTLEGRPATRCNREPVRRPRVGLRSMPPREPVPNMRAVAASAGVSVAAVSLALRDHPSISAATRVRIQAIARRLGYRSNPLVSALMSSRAMRRNDPRVVTIACLVFEDGAGMWDSQPVFRDMFEGAGARAGEHGYRLEKFRIKVPDGDPARIRRVLRSRGILAVLVAPLPGSLTDIDFDFDGFAVVSLGMSVKSPVLERVANDHYQSSLLAFRRCTGLGYRRIGLVLNREVNVRLDQRWLAGYYVGQGEVPRGRRVPPLLFDPAEPLLPQLEQWRRRHRPDLVITGESFRFFPAEVTNRLAMAFLTREATPAGLAGIDQNGGAIGAAAIDHLLARVHHNQFGPSAEPSLHTLPGTWVDGRTAAPIG